jgi:hypothetical protein
LRPIVHTYFFSDFLENFEQRLLEENEQLWGS